MLRPSVCRTKEAHLEGRQDLIFYQYAKIIGRRREVEHSTLNVQRRTQNAGSKRSILRRFITAMNVPGRLMSEI